MSLVRENSTDTALEWTAQLAPFLRFCYGTFGMHFWRIFGHLLRFTMDFRLSFPECLSSAMEDKGSGIVGV